MERLNFVVIKEAARRVRRPVEVVALTFALATGVNSASAPSTQADRSSPAITSGARSGQEVSTSQTKEPLTIKIVECTTVPVFPSQPDTSGLSMQATFTPDIKTVPCVEVDYPDGSGVVFLSPFAYTKSRKGPDGTNLFPTLCQLPGIAEPTYGPQAATPAAQALSEIPSYCVYPPVKDGGSIELLPPAQPPAQTENQTRSA